MSEQSELSLQAFLERLERELEARRKRNSRYSIRAFARDLGVANGTLTRLLNRSSTPSPTVVEKIAKKLALGVKISLPNPKGEKAMVLEDLRSAPLKRYGLFIHFSILAMAEIDGFELRPANIGKCLGVDTKLAKKVLDELTAQGVLRRMPSGKVVKTSGRHYQVQAGGRPVLVSRMAAIDRMREFVDNLTRESYERSEFAEVFFGLDPKRLEETKSRMRTFRRQTAMYGGRGRKKAPYILTTYLMPLEPISKRR